jgi:hypothetical protein
MATAADDDEIGIPVLGFGNDLSGRVTKSGPRLDRRRSLCRCRSARPVEHFLGRRDDELLRRVLNVLDPRIFLEGRVDRRGRTRDHRQ